MSQRAIIRVALPTPLRKTFDYLLPESDGIVTPVPGMRVSVPFGKKQLIGFITEVTDTSDIDSEKLKHVSEILDHEPALDEELLSLYHWASRYYHYPIGQAIQTGMPASVRTGKALEEKKELVWQLTQQGKEVDTEFFARAHKQFEVHKLLAAYSHLSKAELDAALDTKTDAMLKSLQAKEIIEQVPTPESSTTNKTSLQTPLPLNAEQSNALKKIIDSLDSFIPVLLEGITGSGKTEVYLQAIEQVLTRNQQVLLLVPEISLTPQIVERVQKRFSQSTAVFHSNLNDSERLSSWLRARSGKASIIIGTRSVIFTPLKNLGLIIVDEEHDATYKQQDGFSYSGRDLAIYRASVLKIPIVLGTATPSLESLNNALQGRYLHLQLKHRAGKALLPKQLLIDLKNQALVEGYSEPLLKLISRHLDQGNQILVFLNRRGFSPILLCENCGWIASCKKCDASFTLHQNPAHLNCHHCETRTPIPNACPECSQKTLSPRGIGTERSEQLLKQQFDHVPVFRIDRDSTRKKQSLENLLQEIHDSGPCLLIGTQMLSKGHHFPDVTLAVILDADSGLFSANFRGQEQMGQLLTQVAGRAGRGIKKGEVAIQTYNHTHPLLNILTKQGYGPFARELLKERQLGNLPPFSYQALIKTSAIKSSLPYEALAAAKKWLSSSAAGQVEISGPFPSPIARKGGKYRAQLILESSKRNLLHQLVNALEDFFSNDIAGKKLASKVAWSIDIDPIDFS